MSLAQVLSTFLTLNLLIIIGWAFLRLYKFLETVTGAQLSSATELGLHYTIVAALLGLTVMHPLLPTNELLRPMTKVWSAQSLKSFSRDYSITDAGGYLAVPKFAGSTTVAANQISIILWILSCALVFAILRRIFIDLRGLQRIKKNSFLVRRIGRVSIYVNEKIAVPFSYWIPGQAVAVLPSTLVAKPADYQIAVRHELQHHRQADTTWVYVLWGLRVTAMINPIVHLWSRWISEIQEFACDETLVDQKKVESRQYARCLVEVAQSALNQRYVPVCATGLVFLSERHLLKRRIEKMLNPKNNKAGWSTGLLIAALITTVMGGAAYASKGLVQDRRVNMSEAKRMLQNLSGNAEFPIALNDQVLRELNRYIGTPEGRDFFKKSLLRMKDFQPLVDTKLSDYQAPAEFSAIPIVESGYQNLADDGISHHGAGIWMFIQSTARNYHLRVDDTVDERMDSKLLTDAAMRYLTANQMRFGDWRLAVLAYNMGESAVQKAIIDSGTRDPWVISDYSNDQYYLPRLMAAILIMKNPRTIE